MWGLADGSTTQVVPAFSWPSQYWSDWVWIETLVFIVLGILHGYIWVANGRGYSETDTARSAAATSLGSTVTGGITAVGILIPVTLAAAAIGHPGPTGLSDVFFADAWFTLSLVFGLYALFSVGVRGPTQNILNRPDVGIAYGLQLIAMLVGMIRLLIGIAIVFAGGTG